MRHHLFTVARSSLRVLLIRSRCVPTYELYTPWACSAPLNRTRHLLVRVTARGPVQFCNLTSKKSSGGFRMSSVDTSPSTQTQEPFSFGSYWIGLEEVFLTTKLSFAFVNLRPVVPGLLRAILSFLTLKEISHVLPLPKIVTLDNSKHVLVCPKRVVPRFADLSAEEVTDLWLTAQRVGEKLEPFFHGSSLTLAIQDVPEAGQTVPHVHVHILPRKKADFKNNDEIYDGIDKKEKELGDKLNLDEERKDRTPQVMHEEATKLSALF